MSPRRLLILTACVMLTGCAALAWFAVVHPTAGHRLAGRPVQAAPLVEAAPGGSTSPGPTAPDAPAGSDDAAANAIPAVPAPAASAAPSSAVPLPAPPPGAPAARPGPPDGARQVGEAPAPSHPRLWTSPHHYRGGHLRPVRFRHPSSTAPRTGPAVARARLAAARQVCDRTATIGVLSPWTAICHWMLPR